MADKEMVEGNKPTSCCKCSLEYVSVACNRTPLCVDWGRNGWVAYGACYSIALYRPKVGFKALDADPDFHVQRKYVLVFEIFVSLLIFFWRNPP